MNKSDGGASSFFVLPLDGSDCTSKLTLLSGGSASLMMLKVSVI